MLTMKLAPRDEAVATKQTQPAALIQPQEYANPTWILLGARAYVLRDTKESRRRPGQLSSKLVPGKSSMLQTSDRDRLLMEEQHKSLPTKQQ